MNESAYLAQLAPLTGLRHYPTQGPWGKKSGSLIGIRDGYIECIGFVTGRNERKVVIILRFKTMQQSPEMLKTAVTQSKALGDKKQVYIGGVGPDFLRCEWRYSLTKPKPEEVAELAGKLLEAIKPMAGPFDGRCEKCMSSSTSDMTLLNGLPMYMCGACQQKIRMELDQAAIEYSAKQANYPNGILLGIAAAIVGAFVWGIAAYALNHIFLYGAILIGYLVAQGMIRGTGKVTLFGQITIPILTVASVLFGDAIFYTLAFMKAQGVPFSTNLFGAVVSNLYQIEVEGNGVISLIFGLIGAGFAVYSARKPKFKATFEQLGAPGR